MPKLPLLTGKELIKLLELSGFRVARQKGSHIRLLSDDDRATTVPMHGNKTIPKGLLRKIIREDMKISLSDFIDLYDH